MADSKKDLALLKRQLDQAEKVFDGSGKFRTVRKSWDLLINRRAPVQLDDSLKQYGDGIDIESSVLEEDRGTHIKILTLDQPKIDATSLEQGKDAEKDIEDIRIWDAASMFKQNKGNWVSNVLSQGQVQYGVQVMRKRWHMPEEPGQEWIDERLATLKDKALASIKPEDGILDTEGYWSGKVADAQIAAREAYFKEQKQDCFWWEYVGPYEMSWFPVNEEPEIVFQVSEIPYIDAVELTNDKGEYASLDELGKIAFVGKPIPTDEWEDDSLYEKTVQLIVRDMKDKKTGQWQVSEYLCPSGGNVAEDSKLLKTYANPLGRSMYFIVPSGDVVITESDPHLRYRPMMYPEIVKVQEVNYYSTKLAATVQKHLHDENTYIDASKLSPEFLNAMEEYGTVEGVGAQRRFVFKRPTPGSGDILVVPEIKAWPNNDVEALERLLEAAKIDLAQVRPNRFLTGQAYTETKEGTGAAVLDQHQAAALPYGAYLVKQEQFWKDSAEAEHNAILFWDKASPTGTGKPYYVTTSPDMPLLKGSPDPGKNTMINAAKLGRNFVITVSIKNETQQEKAMNDQMAYNDFAQNTITEDQLYRRLGHDDPKGQAKRLEKSRLRKSYQPRADSVFMQAIETQFSALSYLNLTQMASQPMPGQQPQLTAPKVDTGARPSITPSPIEGPTGTKTGPTGVAG